MPCYYEIPANRPIDRGFDQWVGLGDGGTGTSSDYWDNDKMNDTYMRNGKWEKFEGFGNDIFFDETIDFISKHKEEPFFVYLATNIPHGPWNVLNEWRDEYSNVNRTSSDWESEKDFLSTISRFDKNFGRLKEFLSKNKLDENTILIFLTDNGTSGGESIFNAGMRGKKGSVYEGGHRVPCFIHWPAGKLNKPRDIDHLTSHFDILPTLIDLCGLKTPERGHLDFDGRSLVPLIYDEHHKWEDRVIFMHEQNVTETPVKGKNSLVATEKWRFINGEELYDIQLDTGQNDNIADQHPDVVKEFSIKYDEYWDEIQMGNNPYPRPIIGSGHDEETWLTSDAWILDNPKLHTWNQSHVLDGVKNNGFWPVEIAADGLYQFDVRRWPKEINHPISASLPQNKYGDIFRNGKPVIRPEGKKINVVKVRLRIGNQVVEKDINDSDINAVFNLQLQSGPTIIRAWLIDADGREQGAYYAYIHKMN